MPTRLDDWEAFTKRDEDDDNNPDKKNRNQGERRPPKAKPDEFGARPGRTTVLHPLDNDSAPAGRVLSIQSVEPATPVGARPLDQPRRPDGADPDVGGGESADAVRVRRRRRTPGCVGQGHRHRHAARRRPEPGARADGRASSRGCGRSRPGGSIALPVLADWRDRARRRPALGGGFGRTGGGSGAAVRSTVDGRVRFTAPAEPGQVKVTYAVADGRSAPGDGSP